MKLTVDSLCMEALNFSRIESEHLEPRLYGVTDGKAIGTYIEHKFTFHLVERGYDFAAGNSALGIDFPGLEVDIKVTSSKQPQSSCPFRTARQKVYGLGYSLLIFVYDKYDDIRLQAASLRLTNTIFVDAAQTGDFQMTKGLRDILFNDGNEDDLIAFMYDRNLPADSIELRDLATNILRVPPQQGYLTISNALQWRLQYGRVIDEAGLARGVRSIYRG